MTMQPTAQSLKPVVALAVALAACSRSAPPNASAEPAATLVPVDAGPSLEHQVVEYYTATAAHLPDATEAGALAERRCYSEESGVRSAADAVECLRTLASDQRQWQREIEAVQAPPALREEHTRLVEMVRTSTRTLEAGLPAWERLAPILDRQRRRAPIWRFYADGSTDEIIAAQGAFRDQDIRPWLAWVDRANRRCNHLLRCFAPGATRFSARTQRPCFWITIKEFIAGTPGSRTVRAASLFPDLAPRETPLIVSGLP